MQRESRNVGLGLPVVHYPTILEVSGKWRQQKKQVKWNQTRAMQKAVVTLQNHVPCFYHHVLSTLTALEGMEEEEKGTEGGEHCQFHRTPAYGVS